MKQYLLAVHSVEGDPVPSAEEMQTSYAQVEALNNEIKAGGAWVFAGGLFMPASATVVRVENGVTTMTDGPFAETKEQLGGIYVIDVKDLNEAMVWASKIPDARSGSIEIRPLMNIPEM